MAEPTGFECGPEWNGPDQRASGKGGWQAGAPVAGGQAATLTGVPTGRQVGRKAGRGAAVNEAGLQDRT